MITLKTDTWDYCVGWIWSLQCYGLNYGSLLPIQTVLESVIIWIKLCYCRQFHIPFWLEESHGSLVQRSWAVRVPRARKLQVVWALWSTSARRDEVFRQSWDWLGHLSFFFWICWRCFEWEIRYWGNLLDILFIGRVFLKQIRVFQGVCYGNSTFYHPKNDMGTCPHGNQISISWGFPRPKWWFKWRCKCK